MGKRINAEQADLWRDELRQGYTVDAVATRHGVSAPTVRRHASFVLGGRALLLGTEVHISGMRGRWEFHGEIGYTKDGEQYAKFVHSRTGRSRIFHTKLIGQVHRQPTRSADADQ